MLPKTDILIRESLHTLRSLRKESAFSVLSILLLALGIGSVSAIFMLLWQVLYAQLPVPHSAQIFAFSTNVTHNGRSDSDAGALTFSVPTYRYLADHFTPGASIAARHGELVNVETSGDAEHLRADFVSGNFFDVLQVKTAVGSPIKPSNDRQTGDRFVAVLAYEFWQQSYAGQLSAWNSILRINGVPFRVIGVAPPHFHGIIAGQAPKLYVPVATYADLNPGWHEANNWSVRWLNPFVRLPDALGRTAAEAQLQPVYRAAVRQELVSNPVTSPAYLRELSHEYLSLTPASQGVHAALDSWTESLRLLQWMTLALLALTAINVTGLTIVRAIRQKREMLIRYAVGATRPAVMRLYFLQTLALSLAGGLLALLLGRAGMHLLVHLARLDQNGGFEYQRSTYTLLLHAAAVIAVGLLIGVMPAWQAARINLAQGLSEGSSTHSSSRSQTFARRALAASQIAMSLVLAIAAGLFATSLHKLVSVPVGFNPAHLSVFAVDPKLSGVTPQASQLLLSNLADRLRAVTGVTSVSYGNGGPFPQEADVALVYPGAVSEPVNDMKSATHNNVGTGYFTTLGIPLLAGREFDDRDRANTPNTAVLNEAFARQLFGNSNPLGRNITLFNFFDPPWLGTIVGIAADHRQTWRRSGKPEIYTAAPQAPTINAVNFYVRTRGADLSERAIRTIVHQQAPTLAAFDVASMPSRMAEFASADRALAILVASFASLSLIVAVAGIYGVISYGASLRTTEFGVRVAVGATPADILRLVLREAVLILVSGLSLAAPLAWFSLSLIRHQITNVSFREPGIYLAACLLLAFCCLAAALVPARRAMHVSLGGTLRHS